MPLAFLRVGLSWKRMFLPVLASLAFNSNYTRGGFLACATPSPPNTRRLFAVCKNSKSLLFAFRLAMAILGWYIFFVWFNTETWIKGINENGSCSASDTQDILNNLRCSWVYYKYLPGLWDFLILLSWKHYRHGLCCSIWTFPPAEPRRAQQQKTKGTFHTSK